MRNLAALLVLASLYVATPAAAQTEQRAVVAVPASFAETAVASCAGGAMIGYLAVATTGGASPLGTAALFCGLSIAATTASTVALWTWHRTTSLIY